MSIRSINTSILELDPRTHSFQSIQTRPAHQRLRERKIEPVQGLNLILEDRLKTRYTSSKDPQEIQLKVNVSCVWDKVSDASSRGALVKQEKLTCFEMDRL
jgi:hypothetical protein